MSKKPDSFGKGSMDGIAAGGSANNAAISGAWTPALVFGIPGDSVTAIAIGVLLLKGMTPGPRIFLDQPELTTALFGSFLVANIMMVPVGMLAIFCSDLHLEGSPCGDGAGYSSVFPGRCPMPFPGLSRLFGLCWCSG